MVATPWAAGGLDVACNGAGLPAGSGGKVEGTQKVAALLGGEAEPELVLIE